MKLLPGATHSARSLSNAIWESGLQDVIAKVVGETGNKPQATDGGYFIVNALQQVGEGGDLSPDVQMMVGVAERGATGSDLWMLMSICADCGTVVVAIVVYRLAE